MTNFESEESDSKCGDSEEQLKAFYVKRFGEKGWAYLQTIQDDEAALKIFFDCMTTPDRFVH